MVIVAGHVSVEPRQRGAYLAGCVSIVERARGAAGCLDVAVAADLIDPGRVNIFEHWESRAALETFRRSAPSDEHLPARLSVSVAEFDVAGVRPLFGTGTPRTRSTDPATTDGIGAARSGRTTTEPTRRDPRP